MHAYLEVNVPVITNHGLYNLNENRDVVNILNKQPNNNLFL